MEYGININFLKKQTELKNAAKLVSKAGFSMLDYAPPLVEDNWEILMKEHLKIFDEYGLMVHQTHAPFNRYGTTEISTNYILTDVLRQLRIWVRIRLVLFKFLHS